MGKSISLESIVVATGEPAVASLGHETVILDLRRGIYYSVDAVGSRIWPLLQKPIQVRDVRDRLLEQYDVVPDDCERDLLAFLKELAANELVSFETRSD